MRTAGVRVALAAALIFVGAGGALAQPGVWRCIDGQNDGASCYNSDTCSGGICVDISSPAPCDTCPRVIVGSAHGIPGSELTVTMTFQGGDAAVSGVQNDLRFAAQAPIVRCAVNPEINENLSGFHILHAVLRALIIGIDAPLLPDAAVLYTCTVHVAPDAAPGRYPLQISNLSGSTASGNRVEVGGSDGAIVVDPLPAGATPPPTRTPTLVPTPPPTVDPATVVTLAASTVTTTAGTRAALSVSYDSNGTLADGIQNDLVVIGAALPVARPDGRPDCSVNPSLDVAAARFEFVPYTCRLGGNCVAIRVEIFGASTLAPTAELYTCAVRIGDDVPAGTYVLRITSAVGAHDGTALGIRTVDGSITVVTDPGATPRPTWTATATATATPTTPPPIVLAVGSATGVPGADIAVDVRWQRGAQTISWLAARMYFEEGLQVQDCRGNLEVGIYGVFLPVHVVGSDPESPFQDCTAGVDCNAIGIWSDGLANVPDDAVLFTCSIYIESTAARGAYAAVVSAHAINTDSNYVPVTGINGTIAVESGPERTPTPAVVSSGQGATSTNSASNDSGGCTIASTTEASTGVPLLVCALLLAARRRFVRQRA